MLYQSKPLLIPPYQKSKCKCNCRCCLLWGVPITLACIGAIILLIGGFFFNLESRCIEIDCAPYCGKFSDCTSVFKNCSWPDEICFTSKFCDALNPTEEYCWCTGNSDEGIYVAECYGPVTPPYPTGAAVSMGCGAALMLGCISFAAWRVYIYFKNHDNYKAIVN